MRIGLIDCDRTKFPNLTLMKLSAYHKAQGDSVEWYQPFSDRYDKVYISRVFSTTPDYDLVVNADEVVRGAQGMRYTSLMAERYIPKEMTYLMR